MPTKWRALCDEMGAYFKELEEGGRSKTTRDDYNWALKTMFRGLLDAKREINPRRVRKEDVDWLKNEYLTGGNRHKKNMIQILLFFLRWAGNPDVGRWKFAYGDTTPRNVRWLSNEQAAEVRLNAVGMERMIVHLGLDLGVRRGGMLNLKTQDFTTGRMNEIHLLEKGRNGGKARVIPWDPQTDEYLSEYLEIRQKEIDRAREKNPGVAVPARLFIYERGGKLYGYKKSAINKILAQVGERLGFRLSTHDLRRTCGRQMYFAGVLIEKIAQLFGHADTRTTLRYLGLDKEDLVSEQKKYAEYRNALNRAFLEGASVKSGPSGI